MRRAEQITIDGGTPSLTLMENAGRAVAEEVVRRFPRGSKVAVCCGRGNNGGDGFVCARILRERGFQVRLGLLGKPEELKAEPKEMARRWDETIEPLNVLMLEGADIVIDGIMGAGLKGPVNGEIADIIQSVNDKKTPVVAIDMPTGMCRTTSLERRHACWPSTARRTRAWTPAGSADWRFARSSTTGPSAAA